MSLDSGLPNQIVQGLCGMQSRNCCMAYCSLLLSTKCGRKFTTGQGSLKLVELKETGLLSSSMELIIYFIITDSQLQGMLLLDFHNEQIMLWSIKQ